MGKIKKDGNYRGCRNCGNTGWKTIMVTEGVLRKDGKVYEVLKPKKVRCQCGN